MAALTTGFMPRIYRGVMQQNSSYRARRKHPSFVSILLAFQNDRVTRNTDGAMPVLKQTLDYNG
jgi:hypothetical protein